MLCKMFKLDSKQHLIEMARLIQQERQGAIIEILRKAFVLTPHDVHPTALEAMAMALRDIATALYERGM